MPFACVSLVSQVMNASVGPTPTTIGPRLSVGAAPAEVATARLRLATRVRIRATDVTSGRARAICQLSDPATS